MSTISFRKSRTEDGEPRTSTYDIIVEGEVVGTVRRGYRHTYGNEWFARAVLPDGRVVKAASWDRRQQAADNLVARLKEALDA